MLVFILGVDECLFGGRFLGGVACSNGARFVGCLGDTSYFAIFKYTSQYEISCIPGLHIAAVFWPSFLWVFVMGAF